MFLRRNHSVETGAYFTPYVTIVCRTDDLSRFVTRGQCAHSHPRGGIGPIISSQGRYNHFDTTPYLSQSIFLFPSGRMALDGA